MPYTFATSPADVVTDSAGNVLTGVRLTVWTAIDGTQITSLFDLDGNILPGYLTSDAEGRFSFRINGSWAVVWLRDPEGDMWSVTANESVRDVARALDDSATALAAADKALTAVQELGVTVTSYGADPTGTQPSQLAFREAIAQICSAGGGTLIVPPGTYLINSTIELCDNLNILGPGATLTKKPGGYYAYFVGLSHGQTGYGSGPSNVYIRGLRFLGDPTSGRATCPFALHHAQQVRITQCVFEGCQGPGGHTIDLAGCDQILIDHCRWLGANPGPEGSSDTESIQIDCSSNGALSYDDDPGSYDGLMTRKLTVRDCEFLPLQIGGTIWPSPNPLGCHFKAETVSPEHIVFENNLIVDPAAKPSAPTGTDNATPTGVIHLPAPKHLIITGNRFVNTSGRVMRVISVDSISSGHLASWDPNQGGTTGEFASPNCASDVQILGNEFTGWLPGIAVGTAGTNVITIHGLVSAAAGPATDIRITGNTFRNTADDAAAVEFTNTVRALVTGNFADDVPTFSAVDESSSSFVIETNPGVNEAA